ncbi:TPA: hypothetical protein ACH3X1_002063 [Trebouxia sp. C0004]
MLRSFQNFMNNAKHSVILTGKSHLHRKIPFTCVGVLSLAPVVSRSKPNKAHFAVAALETRCKEESKKSTLITQNIDRLHQAAGSQSIIELHGSLRDVCRADRQGC